MQVILTEDEYTALQLQARSGQKLIDKAVNEKFATFRAELKSSLLLCSFTTSGEEVVRRVSEVIKKYETKPEEKKNG